MNVIFIIVDALRWDYMSQNGYPRPTTPNLDRLKSDFCVFDRCYASINQTDMSLTSIFSGLYPPSHGLEQTAASMSLQDLNALNVWHIEYLPQMLKQANFKTVGVDWFDRWHQWGYDWYWGNEEEKSYSFFRNVARRFPTAALFAVDFFQRSKGKFATLSAKRGPNAQEATDLALNFLEGSSDSDFFCMLHYWDVHVPYEPSAMEYLDDMQSISLYGEDQELKPLLEGLCKTDVRKEWLRNHVMKEAKTTGDLVTQYCSSIRTVDEQIGRIYRYVEQNGLLDETLLLITSDHGENLFEDGYFFEHSGVSENIIHVPLMMFIPGIQGGVVKEFVSHIDIVPTLCDFLGLPSTNNFDGLSILPLLNEQPPFDRKCIYFQSRLEDHRWGIIVDDKYKYVENRQPGSRECVHCGEIHHPDVELYDLSLDPFEKKNISKDNPQLSKEIKERLIQLTDSFAEQSSRGGKDIFRDGEGVYSSAEQELFEKRLRDLGYID